ncbi:MAG TPA: c-type cytochrome [Gemmatimonadales bacterium]|nr:c-type cytochrome [Gemmatimonadales bacterium]
MLVLLAACGGGGGGDRADTAGTASIPPAEQPTTGTAAVGDTTMASPATGSATAPAASSAGESASVKVGNADTTLKPRSAATAKPSQAKAQDTAAKTAAAPKPSAAPAAGGAQSPQQVALGDSIFHGQVGGGTCTACHGQDAKGTAVAPDLTDQQWLNGDGSYAFIVKTITNGVPQPKQHPAPMPPKGGSAIDDQQVKAVAAYVFSLSHKR